MVLNTIKINERLKTALSFIQNSKCMADIGSDHGYASIYAIQKKIANCVIATDISKPSLEKTEKLVLEYALENKIKTRVGNGLSVLEVGEADVAFVCGMGADLIADIVENSPEIANEFEYMILQPMNNAEPLRRRIIHAGYSITDEGIVTENSKFYQIIKCKKGLQKLSDVQYELGTFVYNTKIPLAKEYIMHMIKHCDNIINYVGENNTALAENRIKQARAQKEEYEKVLEWARVK